MDSDKKLQESHTFHKTEAILPFIAQGIVAGRTQAEIASDLGMTQSNVSRLASREDCKAMIEEQTRILLSKLPDVISLIHNDIDLAHKISSYLAGKSSIWPLQGVIEPKDMLKFYDSAYKKAQDLLKSSGILPGATSSVVISQVFNAEKVTVLNPTVQKILDKFTADLAIDTECVEEKE